VQNPDQKSPAGVQQFQAVQTMQMQIRMGPLPTAEELAKYDAVLPGTAERLVRQMERMTELAVEQQKHRFGLENRVIDGNIKSQTEGTRFGGAIALTAIIGGIVLILYDKPVGGLVSILGTLVALVSVFVIGRRKQVRELAEKRATEIIEQSKNAPGTGVARRD